MGRAEKMIRDLIELEACELVGAVQDVLDDLASLHGDRFEPAAKS